MGYLVLLHAHGKKNYIVILSRCLSKSSFKWWRFYYFYWHSLARLPECFPNAQSKSLWLNVKHILVLDDRIGNAVIKHENVNTKLEETVNVLEQFTNSYFAAYLKTVVLSACSLSFPKLNSTSFHISSFSRYLLMFCTFTSQDTSFLRLECLKLQGFSSTK